MNREELAKEQRKQANSKKIIIYGAPCNRTTGNSKLIYHMAKALIEGGHQVHTMGIDYNDHQIVWEGIPIVPSFHCEICGNAHKGNETYVRKIVGYINRWHPDFFICVGDPYQMQQFGIGNINWEATDTKAIMYSTIDSIGIFCNENLKQTQRDYLLHCDKVISTAKFTEEQMKYWLDIDAPTIYEVIDTKNYHPISSIEREELRKKYRFEKDDFIIYSGGRNLMRKRHNTLLDGCAKFLCETEKTYLYLNIPPNDWNSDGTPVFPDSLNPYDFVKRVLSKKYGRDLLAEGRILFIKRNGLGSDDVSEKQNAELYQISDLYAYATGGEGFGLCCHPDTNIITSEGVKKITEVQIGDKVFTHKGRLKQVTNVMKREVDEDLVCITPEKFRHEIKLTKEHPVFVSGKSHYWKESRLLKKEDTILYPAPSFKYYDRTTISPFEFIDNLVSLNNRVYCYVESFDKYTKRHNRHIHPADKGIPSTIDIFDFLKLGGYYLAEGCVSNSQTIFCLNGKKDKDLIIKEFLEKFAKKTNLTLSVVHDTRNRDRWIITSATLMKLLENVFSKRSHDKKVPMWIFNLDNEKIKVFLEALWEGDGNTYLKKHKYWRLNSRSHSYTTVSPHLANSIKLLLLKLGIVPAIQYHKKRKSYSLKICNLYPNINETLNKSHLVKPYIELKVKDLKMERYKGFVYNLEVEDDQSYLTESVTIHNCPAESLSCGVPAVLPNNSTGKEIIACTTSKPKNARTTGDVKPFWLSKGGLLLNCPTLEWVDFGLQQELTTPNTVYESVKFLHSDPELRKQMGVAGREHVLKNFGYEKFKQAWNEVVRTTEKRKREEFKELKLEEKEDKLDETTVQEQH